MGKLRTYIGLFLILVCSFCFLFLAFENYQRKIQQEKLYYERIKKELLQREIEEKEKAVDDEERGKGLFLRPAPLPVCLKGEKHQGCRPLAADETGTTIRGVRNETTED